MTRSCCDGKCPPCVDPARRRLLRAHRLVALLAWMVAR